MLLLSPLSLISFHFLSPISLYFVLLSPLQTRNPYNLSTSVLSISVQFARVPMGLLWIPMGLLWICGFLCWSGREGYGLIWAWWWAGSSWWWVWIGELGLDRREGWVWIGVRAGFAGDLFWMGLLVVAPMGLNRSSNGSDFYFFFNGLIVGLDGFFF